jgi:hypothetical protein
MRGIRVRELGFRNQEINGFILSDYDEGMKHGNERNKSTNGGNEIDGAGFRSCN